MEGNMSNQKLILNQSQRDYYKNRKDRPASRQEGEQQNSYMLNLQKERQDELEKLEMKSVGRASMAGLSMHQAMKDADNHRSVKKRHDPNKRRKHSETSSAVDIIDAALTKQKTQKQDSYKDLKEDKLLGLDQRDSKYKKALAEEVKQIAKIDHADSSMMAQLLLRQQAKQEGPDLMHA